MHDPASHVQALGQRLLQAVEPLVDAADPEARVSPRSRVLCAGLAALAVSCHEALSDSARGPEPEAVARAAALLSLLTKVDDEVIDHRRFHGGRAADRAALRARTRAFLAPTLAAIRAPAPGEGRIALASEVGRALLSLRGPPERHEDLLALIAAGWDIQEEAVVQLSAHPGQTTDAAIEAVTGRISGAWLLMITCVGALPPSARRGLTPDEQAAFWEWGGIIQRADGLADLAREVEDGLIGTIPGRLLWRALGPAYLEAADRGDAALLYRVLAREGLDLQCLPRPGRIEALSARLSGLGAVPSLLAWIHGMLLGRYLAHPLCARRDPEPLRPFLGTEALCLAP